MCWRIGYNKLSNHVFIYTHTFRAQHLKYVFDHRLKILTYSFAVSIMHTGGIIYSTMARELAIR